MRRRCPASPAARAMPGSSRCSPPHRSIRASSGPRPRCRSPCCTQSMPRSRARRSTLAPRPRHAMRVGAERADVHEEIVGILQPRSGSMRTGAAEVVSLYFVGLPALVGQDVGRRGLVWVRSAPDGRIAVAVSTAAATGKRHGENRGRRTNPVHGNMRIIGSDDAAHNVPRGYQQPMDRLMWKILARTLGVVLAAWIAACAPQLPRAAAEHAGAAAADAAAPPSRVAGVAAANPYAVDAGIEILAAGGTAADAAVAIQSVLGLVEPQSSGLGGGGFLLYYDAATKKVTAFNGREAAPKGATPGMFLDDAGEPLSYGDAVLSGRSTGVPGAIAMLGAVHARHGALPWAKLFEPAIRDAEDGVRVPKRMARFVNSDAAQASQPDVRALFSRPDGSPLQAGDPFRNPAYAETLRRIASQGPRALLEPPLRDAIIARTHAEPRPGTLAAADFDAYQPVISDPVCGLYLAFLVCVPPPPSSGVSLLQVLAILDRTDIATRGPGDPQAWYLFAMASRLMYADRDQFVADPEFT